jgi:hypothetical protein
MGDGLAGEVYQFSGCDVMIVDPHQSFKNTATDDWFGMRTETALRTQNGDGRGLKGFGSAGLTPEQLAKVNIDFPLSVSQDHGDIVAQQHGPRNGSTAL